MIKQLQTKLDSISGETTGRLYSDFDLNPITPELQSNTLKSAAVLVPLILRDDGWQVLLTLRSPEMPTHGGQVSFPGGRQQESDLNLCHTALRECEEETGILQTQVEVLGKFETYQTVTDFEITPFVGVVEGEVCLRADPREVTQIFEVPFTYVTELKNFRHESRHWKGQERFFYAIPWRNHYIWGATAGMLRALALRLAKGI